ncbi:MAG: hypothetical protein QOI11_2300 [Candidatus Eremiobacteraeota bacterium]|jgi:hypothetical protein|nr:hypothetical protein [Candidatus Eremiobacteraeota bacterium]
MMPPLAPAQSGIIENSSATQNTSGVQNTIRSTESTLGSLTGNFIYLPSGAQPNAAVVFANGTSQPLSRGTTLRLTGTVTIVAINTIFQGTIYAPTPARQVKTVNPNATVQATITYAPVYGNLNIVIPTLPSGAQTNVTINGPYGWVRSVSRAGMLTGLTPGTYTLTSQDVTYVNGSSYTSYKAPATQYVTVPANATGTATIAYTYIPPVSFSTQAMKSTAAKLAGDLKSYAQKTLGGMTFCNFFVRDFVIALAGSSPEMSAGAVYAQLSAISSSPRWSEIKFKGNWDAVYSEAAARANNGQIVVAVTTYKDEHIAVVMPYPRTPGFNGYVPVIAQATSRFPAQPCAQGGANGLYTATPLSCGFFLYQQKYIQFFWYHQSI